MKTSTEKTQNLNFTFSTQKEFDSSLEKRFITITNKVDRLHNKIDFMIGELKSITKTDICRWHLYYKGAQHKKDAMKLLLAVIEPANLADIYQQTVRCQYVKALGSEKEDWRAVRLSIFNGKAVKKQLSSQLKDSLRS